MKKLIMICCIFFAVSCSVNNEDDLNRFEIQKLYQLYVDDFIANDFESIASYFDTPVDLKSFNDIAETNEDVIRFFKDLKANIQEGYAYSVIDSISVTILIFTSPHSFYSRVVEKFTFEINSLDLRKAFENNEES